MSESVPAWVTSRPDRYGNASGPRLVPPGSRVDVQIAWMEPGEPMLWMDVANYDGGPLSSREAIEIATGLTRGALLAGGVL